MTTLLSEAIGRTEARLRHADTCYEEVSRKGQAEPCGRPAIALRDHQSGDCYYPVCATHARGFCLPLVDPADARRILASLAVSTVGDLTARHIGQTIKYGDGDDIGRSGVYGGMVSAYPDSGRCALWVGGGYEAGVPFDTPCRLVGGGDHA